MSEQEEKPRIEEVKAEVVEEPKPVEKPTEKPKPAEVPTPEPVVKPPEPAPAEEIDIAKGEATPAQIEEIKAGHCYTIKQVAQELGYGPAWIISLVKRGRIKAVKPTGGQWRIAQSEVDRLRTEGIPPLPRKQPEVKASEIIVERKHEERVKPKEKPEEKKSGYSFPLNIIFGEEE